MHLIDGQATSKFSVMSFEASGNWYTRVSSLDATLTTMATLSTKTIGEDVRAFHVSKSGHVLVFCVTTYSLLLFANPKNIRAYQIDTATGILTNQVEISSTKESRGAVDLGLYWVVSFGDERGDAPGPNGEKLIKIINFGNTVTTSISYSATSYSTVLQGTRSGDTLGPRSTNMAFIAYIKGTGDTLLPLNSSSTTNLVQLGTAPIYSRIYTVQGIESTTYYIASVEKASSTNKGFAYLENNNNISEKEFRVFSFSPTKFRTSENHHVSLFFAASNTIATIDSAGIKLIAYENLCYSTLGFGTCLTCSKVAFDENACLSCKAGEELAGTTCVEIPPVLPTGTSSTSSGSEPEPEPEPEPESEPEVVEEPTIGKELKPTLLEYTETKSADNILIATFSSDLITQTYSKENFKLQK